jgi:acyl dehydratase
VSIIRRIAVTQERINSYGHVNGDAERLHYDAAYAKAHGFRGPIAHGTLLAAPLFDLALQKHGPEFLRRGALSVKWTAPVCAGDVQLASIGDDGSLEVVIETVPGRVVSLRGRCSCVGA